ncbi:hypothetical protein [Amycolatopsis suaedae]|uniref:Uncharacterized protein n=1 Tax=Amycolatopsis suaedae TaxID=2510978 RepID=A0A4Q7J831_9PSEU|nr:hypothetical protein [Amycolatopsis suaedae]RZQ62234.1 hypothetical protein EWH70_18275 [Amycolatopsis suaedae]
MTSLATRAELLKLARVLRTEPGRLDFLAHVDPADLRKLREQVTDVLFDANKAMLERMAAASRLLPTAVLATIAERTFGPMLCARVAGVMETGRGVEVAKRLSPAFLADVAAELDPRRATGIIVRIPTPTVVRVAEELVSREDWITVGRFVGHLPDPTVAASLAVIHDAALLQIAFVLDDKDHVGNVIRLLPEARFGGLARAAAEHDLWAATFDLLDHVGPAHRARLVAAVAELPAEHRDRAAEQAREHGREDLLAG